MHDRHCQTFKKKLDDYFMNLKALIVEYSQKL